MGEVVSEREEPAELPSDDVVRLIYERDGNKVRCALKKMSNHELREILIGFWSRLDDADKQDFILELVHYYEMFEEPEKYRDRKLSPIANAVARRKQ